MKTHTSTEPVSKMFELSSRVSVVISISNKEGVKADWIFNEPVDELTSEEERNYLEARQEMFGYLSNLLNVPISIYDLHPDGHFTLGSVINPDSQP